MSTDIYAVFGNRVRVRLLLCLARGPKNVTELIRNCRLAQSAVSQHLAKLKRAGLVATHKEGKEVWYSLKHRKAAVVGQLLESLAQEVL